MSPEDFAPMEARIAEKLPADDDGWQFEPKWDGFRCLAFKNADGVDIRAKSGKPLGRFFPEVLAMLAAVKADAFILDGELVVAVDGALSFEALQMRLHPAESRIRRLSTETPARFILFDVLALDGKTLREQPLASRRRVLEAFAKNAVVVGRLELSLATNSRTQAMQWLSEAGSGTTDGVVAKRRDEPYQAGVRAMIKVKRMRTADCVIGGFRYESARRRVGSLLLGLYDDNGKLDHVGFTSAIASDERAALTKRLEALRAPPGFTGRSPGGASRWATGRSAQWEPLKPELVVEVRFDHVTDRRFRHGTKLVRWRPDKAPRQCTFEQMK